LHISTPLVCLYRGPSLAEGLSAMETNALLHPALRADFSALRRSQDQSSANRWIGATNDLRHDDT
jgi:hypothetical protein